MTSALKVEIDINSVLRLAQELQPVAMQNAWRRTLRKTGNWIKSQTAKSVSKVTKIPQKLLRQRIYFFLRSRMTGKVWLGLNAIEAARLGKVRQTRSGVKAGRFHFDGAWLMSKVAPEGPIYRRVGKERMPYEQVKYDWSGAGDAAFRDVAARAEERLLVVLRQEVNYEIHKALDRAR